jgi:catechol 2,3-dioxygenase-like lactoylglutathione lyase family enzyme
MVPVGERSFSTSGTRHDVGNVPVMSVAPGRTTEAIATLRGVQDLRVTVPDLEEATAFFTSFFGASVVGAGGDVSDARGSSMRAYLNADVRAVIHGSRVLRTPFLNLRLLEATYPGQRTLWPMMLDVGGWHLAGYVDDIDEAMAYLDACDVYVLGPGKKPTTNGPEVGEGSFAVHCMTAFGFHFELLTYPNGRAYMADFAHRLWNPAEPDGGATRWTSAVSAVPGFRGFEHLSLAVADIDEATRFFEGVLGCERFYDMGPVEDPHGSGFGAYANVDARVKVSTVRLFRSPYLNFEVIEPRFPGQNRSWPQLLDVGGWQLGLAVDDLDAALESLRNLEIRVLGGKRRESVDADGEARTRASCLTSFGLYFDLLEGPPDVSGAAIGWHPVHPDR